MYAGDLIVVSASLGDLQVMVDMCTVSMDLANWIMSPGPDHLTLCIILRITISCEEVLICVSDRDNFINRTFT